jgi:predicted TIM-barrel fold metal-dependent hydrolase
VAPTADDTPLVVVSCDSHVGPLLRDQLRDYCPQAYLEHFDAFVGREQARAARMLDGRQNHPNIDRPGHHDPRARLADMDSDGVAAELIWHFSQNGENLPWIGLGLGTVRGDQLELGAVAYDIYNRWLADFCATDPERLLGLVYLPTWDIDASIRTLEWAAGRGLRCVNFPAPSRPGVKEYNHLDWDPFWSACTDLGFTLSTHSGGGPLFDFSGGPGMFPIISYEGGGIMSRRAVWILTFGEVFERHPGLKLVITEQIEGWYLPTMRELDSFDVSNSRSGLPRRPSQYVREHVYVGASFISQWQAHDAVAEGYVDRVLWGRDYPHIEGVFQATRPSDVEPMTHLALRNVFHALPRDATARILGENALELFGLDAHYLRGVAEGIAAPTLAELAVAPGELPPNDGLGFVGQSGPRPLEPERVEQARLRALTRK